MAALEREEPLIPRAASEPFTPLVSEPSGHANSIWRRSWTFLVGYVPIFEWLPNYHMEDFPKDLTCGVTIGCILIAQSLAHAALCGVDVIRGPYSCVLPPLVYAVVGTSREGSVGTGGLVALLTGLQLEVYDDILVRDRAGSILALLVGAGLALMGILRLSFLVRFLSRPALSGFVTGSAFLIITSMLGPLFGLSKKVASCHSVLDCRFAENMVERPDVFEESNVVTSLISFFTLCFLFGSKELKRRCPCLKRALDFKELMVLFTTATFLGVCARSGIDFGVDILRSVPSGLPPFELPLTSSADVAMAKELMPGAGLIALVVFISSFASAKKCALKSGYQVSAGNELFALGLGNIAGGLTGAVPTQIGLSRSGLALGMGVRSQMGAGVLVSAVVSSIILVMSPCLYYVPKCALNSIIVSAAFHLTEFDQAKQLYHYHDRWIERKDLGTWCMAFVGTLTFGAFNGILLAVGLSLLFVLYDVVEPTYAVLGVRRSDDLQADIWCNVKRWPEAKQQPGLLVLRVEGPMFYANSERFQDHLETLQLQSANAGQTIQSIILDAGTISFADATAVQILKEIISSCLQRHIDFYIAGAHGGTRALFTRVLGEQLKHLQRDFSLSIEGCVKKASASAKAFEASSGHLKRPLAASTGHLKSTLPGAKSDLGLARHKSAFY